MAIYILGVNISEGHSLYSHLWEKQSLSGIQLNDTNNLNANKIIIKEIHCHFSN